jgi:glycosyltransferase involved in cell wall biosynthesis
MRILLVHNRYLQSGGEDAVYAAECELLRRMGHEVIEYNDDNRRIEQMSKSRLALDTLWSRTTTERLQKLIGETRPEVAHFHNIFPLISPAAYSICRRNGVAVVQTLHNYRLLCPSALLYRDGHLCESCIGKTPPWPAVQYACYHDSRTQSAVIAAMLTFHRGLATWHRQVDVYIALTEFCREKFIQGGLPAEKIRVKPNFLANDPGVRREPGHYALFAGRLTEEKGLRTLMNAWASLEGLPLKIAGAGPLAPQVSAQIGSQQQGSIEWLGHRSHDEIVQLLKGAQFLVFPSEWYETFGLVAIEAFACGVPVLASRLGALAEIIEEGRSGLFFEPGNAADLSDKVRWAIDHPNAMAAMGESARRIYQQRYTAETNYRMLLSIYDSALDNVRESAAVLDGGSFYA